MDEINYKKIFNENINDLLSLLKIKSVYDESSVSIDMPYGKGVYDALLFMSTLATKDRFIVTNYDNYAISFEIGKGEERIDIVSHLDVVAAKDEDFNIRIEDNKLYGRGTSDMKVPMYLTYLSLKELRQKYPNINKRIRIVLGSDEERTMEDMKYYISKAGYPNFAFTPDGFFPMGIGEKGAIMWTITGDYKGVIESLDAGSQCNIVSPIARCTINDDDIERVSDYIDKNEIDAMVGLRENKLEIVVKGAASHASVPFFGHSATIDLIKLVSDLYDETIMENIYKTYGDYFGRGFNSFVTDDKMYCLTNNLGRLKIKNNKIYGQVDCRYPFGCDANVLTNNLKAVSMIDVSLDYNDEPTLCKEDDCYVKTMLETYRKITNDYSRPIVSGGVSYSRVFKHCVSFGPNKLDNPNLSHQDGEFVNIDDCLEWFKVYYNVLEKLILLEV